MPRQNRVTPFGQILALSARGTLMGNRGILHDDHGQIRRLWQCRRWILCQLEFRGRKRSVMASGRYTELFFLDEATGLAAGHRPRAECQYQRFLNFRRFWCAANLPDGPVATIDNQLHADRLTKSRTQRTHPACLDDLPDGVFITLDADPQTARLVLGNHLLTWSPQGYLNPELRPIGQQATILTPASIVAVLREGYPVELHASAQPLPPGHLGPSPPEHQPEGA